MSAVTSYRWSGDSWEPLLRFRRECDRTFVIGEVAILEKHEERSSQSHRHFFATLADAWGTLPEKYEGRWATPEHFRKWLLIKAGYADHRQHPCHTKGEATRLRAALAPMDPYAIVTQTGCLVEVFTAQSMSNRAMNKQTFQQAKTEMLDIVSDLIGVRPEDLEREGKDAA